MARHCLGVRHPGWRCRAVAKVDRPAVGSAVYGAARRACIPVRAENRVQLGSRMRQVMRFTTFRRTDSFTQSLLGFEGFTRLPGCCIGLCWDSLPVPRQPSWHHPRIAPQPRGTLRGQLDQASDTVGKERVMCMWVTPHVHKRIQVLAQPHISFLLSTSLEVLAPGRARKLCMGNAGPARTLTL